MSASKLARAAAVVFAVPDPAAKADGSLDPGTRAVADVGVAGRSAAEAWLEVRRCTGGGEVLEERSVDTEDSDDTDGERESVSRGRRRSSISASAASRMGGVASLTRVLVGTRRCSACLLGATAAPAPMILAVTVAPSSMRAPSQMCECVRVTLRPI